MTEDFDFDLDDLLPADFTEQFAKRWVKSIESMNKYQIIKKVIADKEIQKKMRLLPEKTIKDILLDKARSYLKSLELEKKKPIIKSRSKSLIDYYG